MCKDLDFDRTTVLDGYEVRLNAAQMEPFLKIDPSKPGLDKFSGESSELVKLLFRKLGVSLNVVVHDYRNTYELGGAGPNGTLVGMLAPVSDGRLDMGMNTRSLFLMWKLRRVSRGRFSRKNVRRTVSVLIYIVYFRTILTLTRVT